MQRGTPRINVLARQVRQQRSWSAVECGVSKELKATTRLVLGDVMLPTANEIDARASVKEKSGDPSDAAVASEGRALAAEIRLCLGQMELTDSLAEGEAATKRLQQLRSLALEYLARQK